MPCRPACTGDRGRPDVLFLLVGDYAWMTHKMTVAFLILLFSQEILPGLNKSCFIYRMRWVPLPRIELTAAGGWAVLAQG